MLPQRWRLEWPDVLLGAIQSIAPRDGISRSGESLTPKFVFLLLPGMGCSSRREHFDVQISSSPWGERFHGHLRSHSTPSSSSSHVRPILGSPFRHFFLLLPLFLFEGVCVTAVILARVIRPKTIVLVTNRVPVARFGLKLSHNESYGLQEPFKTTPAPP